MAETKPKPTDALRTPKPKKKLGLSVPPALRLPHEDLIRPESQTSTSQTSLTSMSSQTSLTRHTKQPTPLSQEISTPPVAPTRDFTRVANSIHREAVPAGLFTGKSKQLYDCLYSLTRGAIVPSRTIRISRPKLMKKAGIGARVTFDANIERLITVGLIQVRRIAGEHDGNEYIVFLPEEISQTSQTSQTSLTDSAQDLVRLVRLENSQTRHTLTVDTARTSGESKTSFKTTTEKIDDDVFAALTAALRQAVREITGKEPSTSESERWRELGEILVTELKIAAGRTTISSAPAFLAEHLRRRLWKKDKRQIEAEAAPPVTTGEPKIDASQCPDCFGTGMWYPEGFEKGVARCEHKSLEKQES
jgi:hypothetical protein